MKFTCNECGGSFEDTWENVRNNFHECPLCNAYFPSLTFTGTMQILNNTRVIIGDIDTTDEGYLNHDHTDKETQG